MNDPVKSSPPFLLALQGDWIFNLADKQVSEVL
jgi:hypothetical protein